MRSKSKRGITRAVAVIGIIAVGLGLTGCSPRSTEGVVTIDDYTAQISEGDVLRLTQPSGKTTIYWKVTFDGDQTVTAVGLFGSTYTGTLCGVDCETSMSVGLFSSLTITERADHVAEIHWPFGWGYWRYNGSE